MEGEGMVAVVRGLRDAGLAVTLLDGNRQYTLMPNSITHTNNSTAQRGSLSSNASTQPSPPKGTTDSSTEPSVPQVDSGSQAIDGRYASMYKTMHCNMRPTSPPVQLTEFPPQRPDVYPGHGNFQVGGTGSGATYSPIRASSPISFRGGMSWPDRGSVCSPRPSHEVDAFANSLRKYPNLSPDRSSEVMERLINYTQNKSASKSSPRNQNSPNRLSEPCSHHTLDPKATTRISRGYEPEVTIRSKRVEEPPTRDRKKDDHYDRTRAYDVRCIRDMSKRLRENVKAMSSYTVSNPICPTIKENHDYHLYPSEHLNSTNSVNMEIQAAVKMISKEVATLHRDPNEKAVALQDMPTSSTGEENIEGECYYVQCLDTNTSFKSIQTTFCPSDETLRPKKSAQTVCSSIDLKSKQRNRFMGRKSKSQEEIKVSKDELRRSLLELIEEVSSSTKSKKLIRDELIKKLFDTDRSDRDDNKSDRGKSKRERIDKYVSTFCPSGCDYVGDFKELVGKLKQSYGDTKQVMRTAVKPFRISEYKKLDFVLKDWINNLNVKIRDTNTQPDRAEILNTVEDKIKELFKNRTKQDFNLKSGIVKIIEELPIEVHQSYNRKSYLHRLVDVLLKRLKNVVICQQNGRVRRKAPVNRSKKILTENDLRDFIRENLMDFFDECHLEICEYEMDELENALIDVLIDSIDCIRGGHIDDASDEMELILQDLVQLSAKQADYIAHIILQNLQKLLNNCNFSQTFTILQSNVCCPELSGQNNNNTTSTDLSIGGITVGDLNANLDRYTNQLSQRINEWLDNLNIPANKDRGFRDVVVNDLAGDIVDRHKYMELNPNIRGSDDDELEALKYQIFKWINKLVGEENTETIKHAPALLQKINSVPVPMLTNPQVRRMNNSGAGGQQKPRDPMKPCLDETGQTCRTKNKDSPQNTQGSPESNSNAPQHTQGSPRPLSLADQTGQNQSGTYSNVVQGGQASQGYYSQAPQSGHGHPGPYSSAAQGSQGPQGNYQGSPGHPEHFSQIAQGSPVYPGNYSQSVQGRSGPPGYYTHSAQGSQIPYGIYGQSIPKVQGSPGQYAQNQSFGPHGQFFPNVQGSPSVKFSNAAQNSQNLRPYDYGVRSVQGSSMPYHQSVGPARTLYGETSTKVLGTSGGQTGPVSYGPSPGSMSSPIRPQDPNQSWNRPPSSTLRNPVGNLSQIPMYQSGGARPASGRMSSPGAISSQVNPNQQSMYGPNQNSMFGAAPSGVIGSPQGAQNITFTGSVAPGAMGSNVNTSGAGLASLAATGASAGKLVPCCIYQDGSAPTPSSLKRLNDKFDEFLKEWVLKIPIQATKPAEQQAAEKARLGIYNGIWKAVTKMKLDPEVFSNPYNYIDAFHEELDALLESLPKSQELEANKARLKAELLEKSLAMNEMIRSTNAPASFKQQIIENIGNNLPRRTVNEQDPIQQSEEVQKLNLAEHYILYTRYKEEDSLKANVHKKNFLKKLEVFLDNIRKKYGTDMDTTAYANEIINSLDRIPIPHINAFKEEADDILLGMEIENWISDLPQNPDNTLPLEKRRIRDAIVKKVQELGSTISYTECAFSNSLKQELPKYLEKIPIKPGTNTDFVIEELANRLKNISRDMRQKTVSFQESLDYSEFTRNMPASSSLMELKSDYGTSFNIKGANLVNDSGPKNWVSFKAETSVEESLQWHSLQSTQAPSGLMNWSQGQQSLQPQPYGQNISGQMPASGNYAGDFSYSNAVPVQNQILGSSGSYGQLYSNVQRSPTAMGQMPSKGPCCSNPTCLNRPHSLTQGLAETGPHSTQHRTNPKGSYSQGFSNMQGSPVPVGQMPSQGPCCSNINCLNRPRSLTQGFSGTSYSAHNQVPQGAYGQGFPSVGGSPLPYNQGQSFGQGPTAYGQVLPNSQGRLGDKSINATQIGEVPQGTYGQGSPTQYNQGQSFGHVPAGYGQVLPSIQESPGAAQISQFPQGYSGQGVPNIHGSPTSYNQGQSFVPVPGPYGQASPNVQDGSVSQMLSQGPNVAYTSQTPHVPYGQDFINVQGSVGPYSQDQSFGPAQVPYGQIPQNIQDSLAPMNQMYSQGLNLPPGTQGPYGSYIQGYSNVQGVADLTDPYSQSQSFGPVSGPYGHFQESSIPAGQMPYQGPNAVQYSQGPQGNYGQGFSIVERSPAPMGQVPISGVTGYYSQEYQSGQPSFFTAGDQVQQTKNQTAQSSGPISAASQVPDNKGGQQKQNLQEMVGGGMGILGTSQEPGTSTVSAQSAQQSQTPKSESQQPAGIDSDAARQTTDQNKSQQPTTAGSNEPSPSCIGPPVCVSTPYQQKNRECPRRQTKRCPGAQRSDGARKKLEMDETDTSTDKERDRCRCMRRLRRCRGRKPTVDDYHMDYPPCYPMMRYPCYY